MSSTAMQYTCRFFSFRKLLYFFTVSIILLIFISFTSKLAHQQYDTRDTALQTIPNISIKSGLRLEGMTQMPVFPKQNENSQSTVSLPNAKPTQAYGNDGKLRTQTPSGITTNYASVETFLKSSGTKTENLERKTNDEVVISDKQTDITNGQLDGPYHGIDLMAQPPINFDTAYKNPCWKENGTIHCLPYYFVIGVKKCGTSELWRNIVTHPDIVKGNFGKEAQWFARKRFSKWGYWRQREPKEFSHDSIDAYADMFRRPSGVIANAESLVNGKLSHTMITGEASPSNLHLNSHWRYLPGNENLEEPKYVILDYIHHFLPRAKIIIIFRDPVERLYSEYFHEFGRMHRRIPSSQEHFHRIVVNGLKLYNDCFRNRTLRSCVYDERIYSEVGVNIQLGIYHVYWQELRRLFPREQILLLQNTELHDMDRTLEKVFKFLEIRSLPDTTLRVFQKEHADVRRPQDAMKGDMLSETRQLLEDFYRPFKAEMCRLTGDLAFLYKHYTY